MMRSLAGLLVVALVAFAGCNRGTPGGPGATDPSSKNAYFGENDDTFNLNVPSSLPFKSTSLHQGGKTEVVISISRGKNFDQDVALKFAGMPSGVTMDPASPDIKHNQTEVKLTFTAADDASLGDFTVKVAGEPTKGGIAKNEFKVTVGKRETFTVSPLSTTLKQGETKDVSISIKRQGSFGEDVTLKFGNMPTGVTMDPASPVIKHGESEVKVTLHAMNDAELGEAKISVTGHPAKGPDASNEFKLTVAKK
jgi:uncharacterized membrane protein